MYGPTRDETCSRFSGIMDNHEVLCTSLDFCRIIKFSTPDSLGNRFEKIRTSLLLSLDTRHVAKPPCRNVCSVWLSRFVSHPKECVLP